MAKEPDPTAADDKGSKALTFSHQKKPYGLPNNTMPQFAQGLEPSSSYTLGKENEDFNVDAHDYFNTSAAMNNFSQIEGTGRAGPLAWREHPTSFDGKGARNELRRQTDEDCFEITSSLMRSVQRAIHLTRQRYEDDREPSKQKLAGFADFLELLSKPKSDLR